MEQQKTGFFSLRSDKGCARLAAIFMALILVSSFLAYGVETSFGEVELTEITIDARGGPQDIDLYAPAGTNDKSSLPCVLISHGGGTTKDVMSGYAIELARRGFVVLNVSSYGAGLSDQPMYDELGYGVETMSSYSAQGMFDAVNYVRTLTFVDQTRIGIIGHSQGARRATNAAVMDSGYFSLNDLMINFMHEELGVEFTEEEISKDAAELAAQYLNEDELVFFNSKLEENSEYLNTRVKAVIALGNANNTAELPAAPVEVQVGGFTVTRYAQVNACYQTGRWDSAYTMLTSDEPVVAASNWTNTTSPGSFADYFQMGDSVAENTWASLNESGKADILGKFFETSIANNSELRDAINARTTRILVVSGKETHSKEFHSEMSVACAVEYFTQTLSYNNGDILKGSAAAIASTDVISLWAERCNLIALIAMVGLLVTIVALLIRKPFFKGAVVEHDSSEYIEFPKWQKWVFSILSVAVVGYALYQSNNFKQPWIFKPGAIFPQDKTVQFNSIYLVYAGIGFLIFLVAAVVLNKITNKNLGLKKLGIVIGFPAFLKTLLISCLTIAGCYLSLALIEYLFAQDFRWWMCVFTEMQKIHWVNVACYFVVLLPFFFVISAASNYFYDEKQKSKPALDIILAVVVASLGVYINLAYELISLNTTNASSSGFLLTFGFLLFIPITAFVSRVTYRLTVSIWAGSFINSFLLAWMWVSSISITNYYMIPNGLTELFGLL